MPPTFAQGKLGVAVRSPHRRNDSISSPEHFLEAAKPRGMCEKKVQDGIFWIPVMPSPRLIYVFPAASRSRPIATKLW